jgi:hypothetical protein
MIGSKRGEAAVGAIHIRSQDSVELLNVVHLPVPGDLVVARETALHAIAMHHLVKQDFSRASSRRHAAGVLDSLTPCRWMVVHIDHAASATQPAQTTRALRQNPSLKGDKIGRRLTVFSRRTESHSKRSETSKEAPGSSPPSSTKELLSARPEFSS